MYDRYKNACESAKATMGATMGAGQSLHDLYIEMLDKAATIGGSPSWGIGIQRIGEETDAMLTPSTCLKIYGPVTATRSG